jgi:hypothetical protein
MVTVQTLFPYLDLLWVPVALICGHAGQKIKAAVFVMTCAVMLRLQVQFMNEMGFASGIFKLWDMPLYTRGLLAYSFFILLFLILSYLSPRTNGFVYIAASISVFFAAFCVSTGLMVI